MTAPWPPDVTLQCDHAGVEPLRPDHAADLARAVGDLHLIWYTPVPAPDDMAATIDARLAMRDAGTMLPFAVLDPDGRAVGMTSYCNVDPATPRVEIGYTWLSAQVQRGPLNTAVKRMMLAHAFDALGCIAVEFRTHYLNAQSRRAIERLGARLDGILRHHKVMPDGSLRDTAVYSVTAPEWPAVRANLDWQIARPR